MWRGSRAGRAAAAFSVVGMLTWGTLGAVSVAVGASAVTAGSQRITFHATARSGVVGDANGYDTLAFDLESGRGGMGGDIQIGSDGSGQATLSGTLEVVPSNQTLPSAPTSATVRAIAGETLLVLDSAQKYVLVRITRATGQTVWFTYELQASVTSVAPPAKSTPPSSTSTKPTSTPSSTSKSGSSSRKRQGAYILPGNCAVVSGRAGGTALEIGVNVIPMFSGQSVAAAKQHMELLLDVAIAVPKDVRGVTVKQSGQVGGYPWTQYLHALGQSGNGEWQFSMQQTNPTDLYRILITSPSLAAAGIADPSTGVTELDWRFDTTSGCGRGAGGHGSRGSAATSTLRLKLGSRAATVNGHAQTLAVPARADATGHILVPFRWLGQAIGATVRSVQNGRRAIYQLGSTNVAVTIGSATAVVNGRKVKLDTPAVIVRGVTLVPVRFVSQELGATVRWDAATRTLTITFRSRAG